MPISLPPISRREFLARAAAAGASLACARLVRAREMPTDAHQFALLADTHIPADPATTSRGVNMATHLETVATDLLGLERAPAEIFIAGDCAFQSGLEGDYLLLRQLLDPLRGAHLPVHLALGNHDHRANFLTAFNLPELEAATGHRHVGVVRSPRANWFLLDSLDRTNVTPGLLGTAQCEWLARQLDQASETPAILVLHHNPELQAAVTGLTDTEPLFAVIRPRRQVKACIFGHTHQWRVWTDRSGIHLVNLPPVAYVFQQGRPSGWVLATLVEDAMELDLWCVDHADSRHRERRRLAWR